MGLIFLVGFMGCGKTSWGRKLAVGLEYEFIDLDHTLEAKAGATVAEYFALHGEEAFRKLESDAQMVRVVNMPIIAAALAANGEDSALIDFFAAM